MHEVPLAERSLLTLDDEQALTGEDEEVLLGALGVVHAVRLAGLQDPDPEAEIGEPRISLERRVDAHAVALEPAGVARVDDEPALAGRDRAVLRPLERGLRNHRL